LLPAAIELRDIGGVAHHGQVAGGIAGVVTDTVDRAALWMIWFLAEGQTADRAVRRVQLLQIVGREQQRFEAAAALPGMQAQRQPQLRVRGRLERAGAKGRASQLPTLLQRRLTEQLLHRRRHAVMGVVPAELEAHAFVARRAGIVRGAVACLDWRHRQGELLNGDGVVVAMDRGGHGALLENLKTWRTSDSGLGSSIQFRWLIE